MLAITCAIWPAFVNSHRSKHFLGFCASKLLGRDPLTQRLQYPLIKEYTLNHIKDSTVIYIRYMP